jgi:hypothetical protein
VIGGNGMKDVIRIDGTSLTSVIGDHGKTTIEHVDQSINTQRIVNAISTSTLDQGGVDHIGITCLPSIQSLSSRLVVFGGAANDVINTHDCTCAIICGADCSLISSSNNQNFRSLSSIITPSSLLLSGADTIRYHTRSTANNTLDGQIHGGTLIAIGGPYSDSLNPQTGSTSTLLMGDIGLYHWLIR